MVRTRTRCRPMDPSDELPYDVDGSLSEGDVVIDHRDDGAGEAVEYTRTAEKLGPYDDRTQHKLAGEVVGIDRTVQAGRNVNAGEDPALLVYQCARTGDVFVTGRAPSDAPRVCPVCGADASTDGVDSCTDAHGDEDGGQDGSNATRDEQDAQDGERTQTALSGFNGGDY